MYLRVFSSLVSTLSRFKEIVAQFVLSGIRVWIRGLELSDRVYIDDASKPL